MNELYVNCRIRVRENIITHVKRILSDPKAKFHVSLGDEVGPGDILGTGQSPSGFRVIHLAKELGASPKQAASYLKHKISQNIYQGELLAEKTGFLGFSKKILLAPEDGVMDLYDKESGDLRFKLLPKTIKLVSGIHGIVDKIDVLRGAITIRTLASLVYGVFGSGKERSGSLNILGTFSDLISSKQILPEMHGQIIVAGGLIFSDALEKAMEVGVAGVVSGGINAGDFQLKNNWSDVGFSIMATEGFGSVPIGDDIFPVLNKSQGKFVILDGNRSRLILPTSDSRSMIYIRKTRLPLQEKIEPKSDIEMVELKVGMKVRCVYNYLLGLQGVIESIDKTKTELPSKIITYMVTIQTHSAKIRIPYNNVEAML